MMADRTPMGFNTWNTFGTNISDKLIRETADMMVEKGYLAAGYEYLVIDDCWQEKDRSPEGRIIPDHSKFPEGIKPVADYVHSKGLKFGIYSDAGVRTCAGFPGSYDHEYIDAATFAEWGVDFLKYDFCHFPNGGDCKSRYLTMAMALRSCGRDILFSACNWGKEDPWDWMRSIGAHMYRSTGDIIDTFRSFTDIIKMQLPHFCSNAPGCYNDIDMLTVGMYGKGNVGLGAACTDKEYRMQFALWCLMGAPLMLGGDLRSMNKYCEELLLNRDLIAIDQDEECRPPYVVSKPGIFRFVKEPKEGESAFQFIEDKALVLLKQLSGGEFALAFVNMFEETTPMEVLFADAGVPYASGFDVEMTDVFTGEKFTQQRDVFTAPVDGHDMKLYRCRLVKR
ncbi:MAG: glycoside hydrolase family 27 protein [Clostridia bacterium]|nr:glycoside hydrolase family 27 protein [Clostridia bacterium]